MTTTNHTSPSGDELLPCPMCGAAPKLIIGFSPLDHAFVDCECGMQTELKDTAEEVVAMWNSRAAASTSPSGEDGQPSDSKPAAPTQGNYPTLQFAHYEAFEEAGRIVDKEMAEFRKLYGTRAAASKHIGEDASNGATKLLDAIISDLEGGFVRCQHCGEQEDTATLDVVPMLRDLRNLLTANEAIGEREAFATLVRRMRKDETRGDTVFRCGFNGAIDAVLKLIESDRAALTAEKVAAEPVALPDMLDDTAVWSHADIFLTRVKRKGSSGYHGHHDELMRYTRSVIRAALDAIYLATLDAAPRPAQTQVALTDEQIDDIADDVVGPGTRLSYARARAFARALLLAAQPVSGGKS